MQKNIIKNIYSKRVVSVGLFHAFTLCQTLLLNKIFTNYWNKTESGVYFLILTISVVVSSVSLNPLNQWMSRAISQSNSLDKKLADKIYFVIIIIFAVSVALSFILESAFYFAITIFCFSELQRLYLNTVFNSRSKLKDLVLYTFINGCVRVSSTIFVIDYSDTPSIERCIIFMSLLSIFFSTIYALAREFQSYKCTSVEGKLNLNSFASFFVPLMFSSGLAIFREQYPRIMFGRVGDSASITDFSVMILIATLIPISIQLLITTSFSPVYYKLFSEDANYANKRLKKISNLAFVFSSFYFLLFFVCGDNLISLLNNKEFVTLKPFIIALVFSYSIYIWGNIRTLYFLAGSFTTHLMVINVISAILSVFSYEYTYEIYGFSGVAISLATINVVFSLICFFSLKVKGFK
ncbi:TPA: hypothetical protein NGT30_000669 [Vibrio parahaemolyticus]|uniref:lipopolysaccharide biosynthesis protein n=1 Tax=Vibrio parahaemolyticus TaxID=670 RepID=UPI00226A0138|nr:hypothetical protein [Vibrio parahaemolyticus]MCX8764049.1 hypothetical protein [Vibrio parahaemolyticus]HCE2308378.1 hypothetical protein [Vibrio parahaemolyticus]HCE4675896.1 hypothetical protein [Vibrio parahaemolyticus]HCG6407514.1 hypothetical protein [Vibrio parahaemolyticus]